MTGSSPNMGAPAGTLAGEKKNKESFAVEGKFMTSKWHAGLGFWFELRGQERMRLKEGIDAMGLPGRGLDMTITIHKDGLDVRFVDSEE